MKAIRAFESRGVLMQAAAGRIAEALERGVSERGEAVAALSGGGTPAPAYELLSAMPLDWQSITFLLVDERFVAPSDPASNEGLLRRTLAPALAAGAHILPMFSECLSLEEAADHADARYASMTIDIALMGMGEDGHTASWFSQSHELQSALASSNPRTVISMTAESAAGAAQRLTLTRAALARAKAITLLITSAEKRALLEDRSRAPMPVDALFDLPVQVETLWAP